MAGETPRSIRAGRGLPDDSANGYSREPCAADAPEGKNAPIYSANSRSVQLDVLTVGRSLRTTPNSYHTKAPHKAIVRLHRSRPHRLRRLVRHGAGVIGVAAQLCGDCKAVESLAYCVDPGNLIYEPLLTPSPTPAPRASASVLGIG